MKAGGPVKVKQVKKFMDSLYTTNFAMLVEKNARLAREVRPFILISVGDRNSCI